MKSKIKSREQALGECATVKSAGRTIGFTSGVFDLLHPGHVKYLEDARALCDFLVVGVNSDSSVRQNKGPLRPICDQSQRAAVVAGLASVDLIFIFDEQNNNKNIELLRPDLYIKAGDYSKDSLSSAPLVEGYGGKVALVPVEKGFSSSDIIEKIAHISNPAFAAALPIDLGAPRPAVFLDRDGVINQNIEYLSNPDQFVLLDGVIEALKKLQQQNVWIVIVTNQPGIGLGYFTSNDLYRVNSKFLKEVSAHGVGVHKLYFCPHGKAEGCGCRKPAPGMIERAMRELPIDLSRSVVVGDMTSDLQLAKNAGCAAVLVKTGKGGSDGLYQVEPDFVAESLHDAVPWIIKHVTTAE